MRIKIDQKMLDEIRGVKTKTVQNSNSSEKVVDQTGTPNDQTTPMN